MAKKSFNELNKDTVKETVNDFNFADLARAEDELVKLQEETGEIKRGFLFNLIDGYFTKSEARQKHLVNRKKYLVLSILTGVVGGHRFYEKRYTLAVIYLLLCWTGISIAMSFIDWMIAVPIAPDEDGNILI